MSKMTIQSRLWEVFETGAYRVRRPGMHSLTPAQNWPGWRFEVQRAQHYELMGGS